MLLCKESIAEKILILNARESNFRLGSYDLTIKKLITSDGNVEDEFLLPPQGMIKVISNEIIDLPNDIIGYVFVKTQLCNEGVLALNIGIVDPGFSGPLQSVLINFGKTQIRLRSGDVFSRISFHTLNDSKNPERTTSTVSHEELIYKVKKQADTHMSPTFMDVESTAEKAAKAAFDKYKNAMFAGVPILALVMTVLTFALNFGNMWLLQSYSKPQDQVRTELLSAELDVRMKKLEEENDRLRSFVSAMLKGKESATLNEVLPQ